MLSFARSRLDYGDIIYDKHHSALVSKSKLVRPSRNSVFKCHNSKGVKLLTRLRFGLSQLHEHEYKHGSNN